MTDPLLIGAFAVFGAALGFVADRLSVRWPAHEEDYRPREIDWRSAVMALIGGVYFGGLAVRWADDPRDLIILAIIGAALVILLATDLDQRILPDVLTLPLIVVTATLLVVGWSPLLSGKSFGLVSGILAAVVAPVFLAVTDRLLHGDLGDGDLKLSVSIGLLCGLSLFVGGLLIASVGFAFVLLILIVVGRLSLRSAIPFGPVLILATFVAVLAG